MQQQQQGMTGNHSMMANQAVMVNTGEGAVMWSVQDDYIIFENLGRKYFF